MVDSSKPSKAMGWLALSLLILAAVSFALPVTSYVLTVSDKGTALGDGPTEIHAPGDRTWGIYVNDADNSGYSESCAVTDSNGSGITIRDPGLTLSSSDTEMLDHVFTTPADGRFTIQCNARSASVRVGPVGSFRQVAIGLALSALLGLGGLITGSIWFARRPSAVPARLV